MIDDERRRQIDDLCDAALDRDADERAAFIETACGNDLSLRADVLALLSHAHRAERFLVTPVDEIAAQVLGSRPGGSLVGRRIGSYEVLSLLGSGGMGEVYRARDTKLGRDVALKVVSADFLSIPDRLARFEREARVLATLNHPHIGAIYGLEEAGGIRALVLELVEGPTLADRLAGGPFAVAEALTIARQIADALEAAHEKGIIHRDLKPANIKLTADGTVKVLDFGLAKFFLSEQFDAGGSPPTSIPIDHTREGVIAGTTAYMSPEHARGKPVDKRTDIWAFGCVLFEMLTAKPAFGGETASDTIAAIIDHDPDWTALPSDAPAGIRRLLERCLEKDPKHRLRDIGDARIEMEEARAGATPAVARRQHGSVNRPRRTWWGVAAAGLIIATVAGLELRRSEYFWRSPLQDVIPTRVTDFPGAEHHAAISRDGKFVTFLSDRDGTWDAWVGQLGSGDVSNLTKGSVKELRNPATRTLGFSPDGSLVTLWSRVSDAQGRGLVYAGWAVPTLGGALRPYLEGIADISELDWSPDGKRLVHHPPAPGDPLFVTELDGKIRPRQIFVARAGFHNHFPLWSRDGGSVYFVHGLPLEKSDLWHIRVRGGDPERLTFHNSSVTFPTWLDDRTLLYLATDEDGYGPWIHAIDIKRRVPHRLFAGIDPYTSLAASADGRRVVATTARSTSGLWRVPIGDGRLADESAAKPLPLPTASGLSPRTQPEYIIYRGRKAGRDGIWKLLDRASATELWRGANGRVIAGPAIARDGRLAFVVHRAGRTHLYVMNADGSAAHTLADALGVRGAPAWSPDAKWLAVAAANAEGVPQLFKVPVDGSAPVQLLKEYSTDPVWAPSGSFLIYSGEDVGTMFPLKAVSVDGAPAPMLNLKLTRGARRVTFVADDTLIVMRGDISHKDFWQVDLKTGHERQLTKLARGFTIGDFDLSPGGREIIFDRARDESDIVVFQLVDR